MTGKKRKRKEDEGEEPGHDLGSATLSPQQRSHLASAHDDDPDVGLAVVDIVGAVDTTEDGVDGGRGRKRKRRRKGKGSAGGEAGIDEQESDQN